MSGFKRRNSFYQALDSHRAIKLQCPEFGKQPICRFMGLFSGLRRNSRGSARHSAPSPEQGFQESAAAENNENLSPASPAVLKDTTPLRPKTLSLTPLSSRAPQSGSRPPAAVLRALGNVHTVRLWELWLACCDLRKAMHFMYV